MILRLWFVLAFLTAQGMAAPLNIVKLKGVSSLEGKHTALFEIPPTNTTQQARHFILAEREAHPEFEFVDFDPATGQLRIRKETAERSFEWPAGESLLHLENASIEDLINIYAAWTSSVQIVTPSIGGGRISYRSTPRDTRETILARLKELARERGAVFQQVAGKFLLVGNANNPGQLAAAAAMFEAPTADEMIHGNGQPNVVPGVEFNRIYLQRAIDLYSSVTGRTVLRSQMVPVTAFVNLKSNQQLTRTEAANALEAAMAFADVQVRSVAGRFTFLYTREAPLIDDLAAKLSGAIDAESKAAGGGEPQPFTAVSFKNMPLSQFCAVYAQYAGVPLAEGQEIPTTFITLESPGTLTKAEALAASEAVLALNGFELVRDGDRLKLEKLKKK